MKTAEVPQLMFIDEVAPGLAGVEGFLEGLWCIVFRLENDEEEEEEEEEEKEEKDEVVMLEKEDDVLVSGCYLRSTVLCLVRRWMSVYGGLGGFVPHFPHEDGLS